MFQVWCSLLAVLCGLSTYSAATRKYYDYDQPDEYMGAYISACVSILLISSLLIAAFLLPSLAFLSGLLGLPEIWILVGILFSAGNFLVQLRLRQWQVRRNPARYGRFQVGLSLLNAGLSLMLVVVFAKGVEGRLIGIFASTLLFGLLGAILLWRDKLLTVTWRPDLMRDALAFSVPLLPHFVGGFLLVTADRAVISSYLGLEAAGHYLVAVQLALGLNLLLQSFHKAYVPWLFERIKRDIIKEKERIVQGTYAYFLLLAGLAFLGFLFGKPVLVFIAGEHYAPAGEIIGYLVLAQVIRGMYYTVSSYLMYAKKTQQISVITIVSGCINIGLLLWLLGLFGLKGAALAVVASAMIQFVLTWYMAARAIAMPWSLKKAFPA